jgi:hypothetical protein
MSKTPDQILVVDGDGNRSTVSGDLSPERLEARGLTIIEDDLAIDRPRRKRTKAEMKQLIKDGVVRDPDAPPEESRFGDGPDVDYRSDAVVVRPESATMRGASREEAGSGGSNGEAVR